MLGLVKWKEQYPLAKSGQSRRNSMQFACTGNPRVGRGRADTAAKGRSPWDREDDASGGVDGHDGKTRRATTMRPPDGLRGMHRILDSREVTANGAGKG